MMIQQSKLFLIALLLSLQQPNFLAWASDEVKEDGACVDTAEQGTKECQRWAAMGEWYVRIEASLFAPFVGGCFSFLPLCHILTLSFEFNSSVKITQDSCIENARKLAVSVVMNHQSTMNPFVKTLLKVVNANVVNGHGTENGKQSAIYFLSTYPQRIYALLFLTRTIFCFFKITLQFLVKKILSLCTSNAKRAADYANRSWLRL